MFWIEIAVLLSDLGILYYVAREFQESKECNRVLMQVLNKQRKQKQKISVDKIIKAAAQETT